MVEIKSALREFLESANPEQMGIFVASCAERMAQLFTGLVGVDAGRSQDVDLVICCLDLLWQPRPQVSWSEITEVVRSLPELTSEEEPPGLLAYAYDAAATLYYATKYRETEGQESLVSCSSHALNSAEYMSEDLNDGIDRHEVEVRNQKDDMKCLMRAGSVSDYKFIRSMRGRGQEVARARLAEILTRA